MTTVGTEYGHARNSGGRWKEREPHRRRELRTMKQLHVKKAGERKQRNGLRVEASVTPISRSGLPCEAKGEERTIRVAYLSLLHHCLCVASTTSRA